MGANAQTTVEKFVDGAVLTAAQQNTSAATGVPVFATTVTRDAAFGGSNKVLAEGQTCYLESTNVVQYYDGAAWATVGPAAAGGLVLVASASPSAVQSVPINNCFTSTYQNYRILVALSTTVGANVAFTARLRVGGTDTATQYTDQSFNATAVTAAASTSGTDEWFLGNTDPTYKAYFLAFDIQNPNSATTTTFGAIQSSATSAGTLVSRLGSGVQDATTQFDGITFITAGTSFTGSIRIYGYANS